MNCEHTTGQHIDRLYASLTSMFVIWTTESRLQIEFSEVLPLPDFYRLIDEHFERRKRLQCLYESVNRAGHQYRVIEKRLLVRFKDRNPSSLDNLDMVLEETYVRMIELSEEVERAQKCLALSAGDLGCAARFLALLAQYRFQLPSEDHAILLAHFFSDAVDTDDQVYMDQIFGIRLDSVRPKLS